ncbi:MMPL family transporter [Campylobacter sp. CX2-8023-23]|uniref:efflux RND transporter permease subunit n=1 Tax=Campylobacter porcelli TaxID=1660073 RepID=UPI002EBBFD11|nr:MMPL family transporter [Campylobacter sp. CX2-8023-23]
MKKIFKFIVLFPKLVLALNLAISIGIGVFSYKLEIDASTQTLLLENDKDLAIYREIVKRYESKNFLIIAYKPNFDLLSKESLSKIEAISNDLEKLQSVDSVFSILKAPLLTNNPNLTMSELVDNVPNLSKAGIDMNAAKMELTNSPLYKNSLVSSDFKTTSIVVNLKDDEKYANFIEQRARLKEQPNLDKNMLENLESEFKKYRDSQRILEHQTISQIREIIKRHSGDEKLFLGGISMIADDMVSFVKSDLLVYGSGVLLLLGFCLWLFFRQIRFVILPIVVCFLSVVLASGLFGLLGYEITVISSNYIALQLIITISVVIHLIVAYRELYFKHRDYTNIQLVYLTLRSKFKPCFFAILTTVIGFLSLCLSDIKPIIMLGMMMSVSISISLFVAFFVFGSLLTLLKKIEPKMSFENSFKFTHWCAKIAIKRAYIVYIISFIIVIIGIYGVSKLRVENSFIGYFKSNTEIYQGMKVIDTELGGTIPLDVIIKFASIKDEYSNDELGDFEDEFATNEPEYWFNSYKLEIIKKVDKFLQERDFIGNVGSLATLLEVGKSVNNNKELDPLSLLLIYKNLPSEYKELILTPYINIENNEARFSIRTLDSDPNLKRDEFIKSLKKDLQSLLENEPVEIEVAGIMVLYNNMLQALFASQADTIIFVVLALFLVFILIFRSIKLSIIGIIANLVPLCVVFGVMGIAGIALDIMSITIAAISFGIGVDDIIHYIHRFKSESRIYGIKRSILNSHLSIGYAMYYTSFAIFLGFSVMSLSNFWPTIYFGVLTDLVMLMMLLGALILLPALIFSFYKKSI